MPATRRRIFMDCAICAAMGLVSAVGLGSPAQAAEAPKRTILRQTELTGTNYICVQVTADFPPDGVLDWHTHPGIESTYVTEGTIELRIKGQPMQVLKAGDGFLIPPVQPHTVHARDHVRLAATYTVEKDKPLASPAPQQG